jgi:translation initiation factor IF-2
MSFFKKAAEKTEKPEEVKTESKTIEGPIVLGKVDLSAINQKTKPDKKSKKELAEEKSEKDKKKATKKPEEEIPPVTQPEKVVAEIPKVEEKPIAPPVKEEPKAELPELDFGDGETYEQEVEDMEESPIAKAGLLKKKPNITEVKPGTEIEWDLEEEKNKKKLKKKDDSEQGSLF